jgi:hypothetical protein
MRSAPSNPRHRRLPLQGGARRRFRKRPLLPKDRCDCQRPHPFRAGAPQRARHRANRGPPRTTAERKSLCPEAQVLRTCSRTALHFQRPGMIPERHHRPGWEEQPLRCGRRDLARHGASFKASLRTSPKGTASRRAPELVPFGPNLKTLVAGAHQEGTTFWRVTRTVSRHRASRPGNPGLNGGNHASAKA